MKKILAVFDFDQTLLEHNSDVAIQILAPGGKVPSEVHAVARSKVWHYRLWSFQERDTKLERFLAKNQLHSNEITKF